MAYKKQEQRILNGGLQLLAPSDLTAPSGAEAAKNWRVDTLGNLRSREGMTVVMAGLGGPVHTLITVAGSPTAWTRRYGGAGTKLYQVNSVNSFCEAKKDAWSGADVEFDGLQLGVASYDGWLWVMNPNRQGRDNGTIAGAYDNAPAALGSFYPWLPVPPSVAPTVTIGAGTLGGAVKYYVTFDTAEGKESNPSPISAECADPVATFGAALTNIPVALNPEVDKRHIYREGGMLPAPYRVHTINDNTSTAWTDTGTVTDSTAIEDGYLLEEDHDPAPPASILAGPYNNRLIAGCSVEHPNRMWWTPATKPWYFRQSASNFEGDWLDVGEFKEEIVAFSIKPRMVVIYKEHSIWRHVGDLGDGVLERGTPDTGLIGKKALATWNGADYFQGREGLFRFDGNQAVKITGNVDPIFKGWQSGTGVINPVIAADPNEKKYACMAIKEGRLYFSYKDANGLQTGLTVMLGGDEYKIFQDSRGFYSLFYEGSDGDLIGGAVNGLVYALEYGDSDQDETIPLRWMSGYQDQGAPNNEKTYQDLVIDHNTNGATLTVSVIADNGETEYVIGSIISDVVAGNPPTYIRTQTTLRIGSILESPLNQDGIKAKNLAVALEGDVWIKNSNIGCQIFGIHLHYFGEARGSLHYDSDEVDLGTQKVKRVRAVELDISNPGTGDGAVHIQVQTDMPGTAMKARSEDALVANSGRHKLQIPIHDYVEGRHVRVLIWGSAEFQLWGVRLWIQTYGTYIEAYEATHGAIYDSFDLPVAPGHVCAGKCLELDVDTDGNVTADVLTDLPGNSVTIRDTTVFDTTGTTGGRRIMRIPTEPYLEGRLWRVKLHGSSALRLYGGKLEVKPFGVYVEGYEGTAGRTWNSDVLDFGTPKVKEFRELQLDLDTDGNVTVNVITELPGLDQVTRQTYTINTTSTTTGRRMFNLPIVPAIEGRLLKIEITGTSTFRLYGAWAFFRPVGYYVEAYQAGLGHIWDSSIIDLGSEKVKRVLQLEVEAHAESSLTYTVYTNNAAGEMVARTIATIPSGTGRKTYMIPLTSVYGRLLRLTLAGTAAFRLFQVRVLVKPIGVYLEANSAQLCLVETEQDVGTERMKLFKEIEVVYDGAGQLDFWTDQPNGAPQFVRAWTLTATAGTQTIKLRCPGTCRGRLLKVQVQAAGVDLKVYQVRVWARVMGENGVAQWNWIPMPIPQTPDQYAWADIYVSPTPPAWEWAELPVPKTPLDWSWFDLPVEKTPELPTWVELPVEV